MMTRLLTATLASGLMLFSAVVQPVYAAANCSAPAPDCSRQIREMLKGRAFLGVKLGESRFGIEVRSVVPGSAADAAGLRAGDRLFAINGRELTGSDLPSVKKIISNIGPTGRIHMTIVRYGNVLSVQARLQKMSGAQIEKVIASHLQTAHEMNQATPSKEVHARADR